jgi:type II secretory pathway pseudopilin PulG
MIEIVVALAILSITMVAMFGALRMCSAAAYHARMLTNSVLLAESLLTEASLNGHTAFETTEGQNDIYRWRIQITPTPVESLGAICVQVEWHEQQRPQQYELLSLVQMETFMAR